MTDTQKLYCVVSFELPGAGTVAHASELIPLGGGAECHLVRLIELADGKQATGGWKNGKARNVAAPPMETVPHPDTYSKIEGLDHELIDAARFEELWEAVVQQFPDLND